MLSEMLPVRQKVLSVRGCTPHVSKLAESRLLALLHHQPLWHYS